MPNIQASNTQKYTKTDIHQNGKTTPDTLENEKNSLQKKYFILWSEFKVGWAVNLIFYQFM
jgi:hypothetical protein